MNEPVVVSHPLVVNSLAILRDKETGTLEFRQQASIVSKVLLVEATRGLALRKVEVETPLADASGQRIADNVVLVPVLRAGLAMLFAAQDFLPDVPVGFIGMERDEQTAVARAYYEKIPAVLESSRVLVLDPMLATGGSLDDTVTALKDKGARSITLVCIVAAPEGIARISGRYPETQIITAGIDSCLNDQKFIVPGLGDFGDRYFGT